MLIYLPLVSKKSLQMAWCTLNDSFRYTICLTHSHEEIAVAALYLSLRLHNEVKPLSLSDGRKVGDKPPSFCGVDLAAIQEILSPLLDQYPNSPASQSEGSPVNIHTIASPASVVVRQ